MIQADDPQMVRQYRVKDVVVLLGISTLAVRHRIRRGTLNSEKDESGVVWVILDPERVFADDPPDYPQDGPRDHPGLSNDSPPDQSLLELVEVLREQLAAAEHRERRSDERERELRRIIAGLVQKVPELPSPDGPTDTPPEDNLRTVQPDERGSPTEGATPGPNGGVPPEPQEPSQRRSWLHRFFFGP